MTSKDVTGAPVSDCEWIAVDAVACLELALVVDAPSVVGRVHRLSWLAGVTGILPSSLLLDHAMASKKIADSRSRGPGDLGVPLLQNGE